VNEGSTESGDAPDEERGSESLIGAEASDGQDPRDFKEDSAETRKGDDVAELVTCEADLLVEAEDSGVAKL
jgi:hypothetical protein